LNRFNKIFLLFLILICFSEKPASVFIKGRTVNNNNTLNYE